MKNVKTIFFKELKRIFTDPRMLIALFLPGILIFVLYTCMGKIMQGLEIGSSSIKDSTYNIVYTDNSGNERPNLLSYMDAIMTSLEEEKTNVVAYTKIGEDKVDEYVTKLKEGEVDVLIHFTTDFEKNVFDVSKTGNNITILYNGASNKATRAYSLITTCVEQAYKNYTVNMEGGTVVPSNVSDKDSVFSTIMSFIIPMVTVSLLFSTVLSICPESIAGEKERGTLANILLTPIKRSELVIGKICSLTITAILSGIFSFVGWITSIPNLMGGTTIGLSAGSIVLFLLIVVTTLVLFTAFGIFMSSLTMTTKEATSLLGPMTMLIMALSLLPSFIGATPDAIHLAFIPVVNLSSCMGFITAGAEGYVLFLVITLIANIIFSALFVFGVTRIFKKEKFVIR